MDYDDRYQDGRNGPLKREVRKRITALRTRGSTLADIGKHLGLSGSFVGQLLNEVRPGRVRSIHVPRIIAALEAAERESSVGNPSQDRHKSRGSQELTKRRRPRKAAIKPTMFIASSGENDDIAYDVQESLEDDVESTVWTQGVFSLSRTSMESLVDQLRVSDFGVFILAPDDVTKIRKVSKQTVRDNVIFELGLFVGHLGRERCFLVVPKGVEDLHLPTDLLGVTVAKYDPRRQDNNLLASLGPASNRIRREVAKLGPFPRRRGRDRA